MEVGVIYSGNEDEEIAYCQRCLEIANIRSKLGNRIYLPDEFGETTISPDADKWRQCHTCGSVYPRYEVKQEGKLADFAQTTDNPLHTLGWNIWMSQSQSFSGKICISCSKSSFVLQDTRITYSSSGTSIQCDTYVCPNCGFMIECHNVKHISNMPKPKAITLTGSPLTNLSLEKSSNPLKIPSYH